MIGIDYAFWLIMSSQHLNHEYGLNDVFGFGETEGGQHYFELPSSEALLRGVNTAYVRYQVDQKAPPILESISPNPVQESEENPSHEVYGELSLEAMHLETRKTLRVTLLKIARNPITGEITAVPGEMVDNNFIRTGAEVRPLEADERQGKLSGFEVSFALKTNLDPIPYRDGQAITRSPALEQEVRAAMQQLLAAYQSRDLSRLVSLYERSWGHIARAYDYGHSARDFAKAVNVEETLNNPELEFFLDFSNSKLRISGHGKLVGFHPSPLMAKEPDGFVANDFPVYFMRDKDGRLAIAK
jgi:hypothetical protein